MWGMELVALSAPRMRELDAWQRRIGRWILRDFRAPDAVVLGDLGWQSLSSLALGRAVALRNRLLNARPLRSSSAVALSCINEPAGWMHSVATSLAGADASLLQVPEPRASLRRRVLTRIQERDAQAWSARIAQYRDPGLQAYSRFVPRRRLPTVHHICQPRHAAAWCRLRHGGSSLSSHRGPRHCLRSTRCRLCGHERASTEHALFQCPGLTVARAQWWWGVQNLVPPNLDLLSWFFASETCPHAASQNARFAYHIERAFGNAP